MQINTRLLIVDDEIFIHEGFNKILSPERETELDVELMRIESKLFENTEPAKLSSKVAYRIDSAYQSRQALDMAHEADRAGDPYAVIFTDVRIPPGSDGIHLVKQIREQLPQTQVVILSAYSDYSWEEMTNLFGWTDRLLILRKPVDPITIKQVALMLTRKWSSERELEKNRQQLETLVASRTRKLTQTNQQLQEEIGERNQAEMRLQDAHERLASANRQLRQEITQHKQTQEQLGILLGELRRANKELEDFAYIVSHDLKAPLRAISSVASWLAEDFSEPLGPDGAEFIEDLLGQTRWMHALIEGILAYSRLGRVRSDPSSFDGHEIVEKIGAMLFPEQQTQLEIVGRLPQLFFDLTHFEQICQNLIENALKHMNQPQGIVTISCRDDGDFWEFCVADNGVGIEERHFQRIFKIFQTLRPRGEVAGSTGVGLSLVKRIVEYHGGKIWVASCLGQGASFFFTVPKELRPKALKDIQNIIVADANRDFGEVTVTMLRQAGFHAIHQDSGRAACEFLSGSRMDVDLILLDVDQENERLEEILRVLKGLRPNIRAVACSGDIDRNADLPASELDGVLSKTLRRRGPGCSPGIPDL